MKTFKQYKKHEEDAPAVSIGGGAMTQEPVVTKKDQEKYKKKNKKLSEDEQFAGCKVFNVDSDSFHRITNPKVDADRYKKYILDDCSLSEIRKYAKKNVGKTIIVKDKSTGSMKRLKIGKKDKF